MLETVFVDGQKIGYQFNPKSSGQRRAHCRVRTTSEGVQYCQAFGLKLVVKPICDSKHLFEAVSQIIC